MLYLNSISPSLIAFYNGFQFNFQIQTFNIKMVLDFGACFVIAYQLTIALSSAGNIYATLESEGGAVGSDGVTIESLFLPGHYVQSFMYNVYLLYKDWEVGCNWHNLISRATLHGHNGRRRFHVQHQYRDAYEVEGLIVKEYG